MKKLFLSALLLASCHTFAAADDSAVANRKWVRELLAQSGVRVLNATITSNQNGTVTYSSAIKSESLTNENATIELTFSDLSMPVDAKTIKTSPSFWSLLFPPAYAAELNDDGSVTFELEEIKIFTGIIKNGQKVYKTFDGGEYTTIPISGVPGKHVCEFSGESCICIYAGVSPDEIPTPKEYDDFTVEQLSDFDNWCPEVGKDNWPWTIKKPNGEVDYWLFDPDEMDASYMNIRWSEVVKSDAWQAAMEEVCETINAELEKYREKYREENACTKTAPQHDWGEEVKISESETLVVYEKTCKRCGKKERREIEKGKDPPPGFGCNGDSHVAKPFGCGCVCGDYGAGRPHPDTSFHRFTTADCRCNCGHFHRAVASDLCPEVCAHCPRPARAGISAQIGDAPAKYHIPCGVSDGRCGCQCGRVTAEIDDITFHVFANGDCQCLGTSGNGGRFHRHMPDAHCKGVCANRNKWGIDGAHTVAPGTVATRPTKAAVSDHTKSIGSRCGCECGDYNNSNADEWRYAANFHNSDPNACGCFCEKSHEGQIPEYHKYGGDDNCVCFCEAEHRLIKDKDGLCARVCTGKNHGEGLHDGYYARKDEEGMKTHTPKADACGCECGAFHGSAYTDTGRFHGGYDRKCACDCGTWHKATGGNPCAKVCNTCDKIAKSGLAAEIREATMDDHTRPLDAEYCGCACAKHSTPHRNATDQCYCYGVSSPVGKNNLFEHGEPALIEHINLELTGSLATNDFSCGACGEMRTDIRQEYKCDNNHFVTSAVPDHVCAVVQCLVDCDCCDHTDTVPCKCPHCNKVEGARKVCTCEGRTTPKGTFKITDPFLTAEGFAELFAAIDRDEVVEIDGDDPVYVIGLAALAGKCCNMPKLETVKFNFVTNIYADAFRDAFTNCPNLKSVQFARLDWIGGGSEFFRAFKGTQVKRLEFPRLRNLSYQTFSFTEIEELLLPECGDMGEYAFMDSHIKRIYAPKVSWLGRQAFCNASKLTELIIPGVNKIFHDLVFAGCRNLTTLSLPAVQSLDDIGALHTFTDSYIKDLYLPSISTNTYAQDWAERASLPAGCTIHFSDGDIVYQGPTE